MTDYFSVIVCGDMCEKRKPYPDGYLKAIQLLQAEKEDKRIVDCMASGTSGSDCKSIYYALSNYHDLYKQYL